MSLLERAFGVGRKVEPVEALEEVATALEEDRQPSRRAAELVAAAIRKCLGGRKPKDRDLLAAAGWKTPSGGRFKTPVAIAQSKREENAAYRVVNAMEGNSVQEKAGRAQQLLVTPVSDLMGEAREHAEALLSAGFDASTSARTLADRARRAARTSK